VAVRIASGSVRRGLVGAITTVLVLAAPAASAPSTARRARIAVRYIVAAQGDDGSVGAFSPVGSTSDAVVAMVAARRAPRAIERALDFLEAQVEAGAADDIGLKAKAVMAAVAGGRNPRAFGSADLVQEITDSVQDNGRLGQGSPVFHHALGLLALQAAGAGFETSSIQWLVDAQCSDGGWQFDEPAGVGDNEHCNNGSTDDAFESDTNTTALAVQVFANLPEESLQPLVNPFKLFRKIRDDVKNGWGYSWNFSITDTFSTALVLQAYDSTGRDAPKGALRALKDLQYPLCGANHGAFAFSWVDSNGDGKYKRDGASIDATIAGVPGLLQKSLPIGEADVTKPAPRAC
jgi:hypothetical protein